MGTKPGSKPTQVDTQIFDIQFVKIGIFFILKNDTSVGYRNNPRVQFLKFNS